MRRDRIRQNRVLLLYLLILILRIHGKPNQMLAGRPVDVLGHRPARPERRQGSQDQERHAEPRREKGQTDVLQLRCDPIPTVRVAFVGLGMRGSMAVERFTHLEGVQVVALCDIRPWTVERAQRILAGAGLPEAAAYTR